MKLLLIVLAAYLIGSIPFSFFASKLKGRDPRKHGTRNVGATNVLVVAGKRAGLLALVGDIGKGAAAVLLARHFQLNDWGIAMSSLAVVLGHDFSVFLKFKGGKGVATTGGILMALDPIFMLVVVLFWILSMLMIRYFIPGTALTFILIPVIMWMACWRYEYLVFGVGNAVLGLYAHRESLQRFYNGKEPTIQESIDKYLNK